MIRESHQDDASPGDVAASMRTFLALLDSGLTADKLADFVRACEQYGPEHARAVREQIECFIQSYRLIDELDDKP